MPDIHVSAQLVSALPPVAVAQGLPIDPSAPQGTPDAFAALLAGKLAPTGAVPEATELAAPQMQAVAGGKPTVPPISAEEAQSTAIDTPGEVIKAMGEALTGDTREGKEPTADEQALPGTPDATMQLLAALSALAPAAKPVQPASAGQVDTPVTAGIAAYAERGPLGPARPSSRLDAGKEETPEARPAEHSPGAASITAEPSTVAPAHAAHGDAMPLPAPPSHVVPGASAALPQVAQAAAPTAAPTIQTVHMSVPSPMGTPLWREEFAASVNLLATQNVTSAELRVQPAALGPIQVSIRIEGGEASIACSAQHAQTRQALEDALPRLREVLESNGISVGSASVGTHPQNSGTGGDSTWPQGRAQAPSGRLLEAAAVDSQASAAAQSSRAYARSDRLLDVYA